MRELRHSLEGPFKTVLVQPVRIDRKMRRFFEQARGIHLNGAAMGGSLAGELGVYLGRDVNGDRHVGPFI